MKSFGAALVGAAFMAALLPGGAWATPPGPGQHFDCSTGGDSSCATDDAGCVSDTKDHSKCSSATGKAFSKVISSIIKCNGKQAAARFKGTSVTDADTADDACEAAAVSKLNAALGKVQAICSTAQNSGAATEAAVIESVIDSQNSLVFCDTTSGTAIGGDDTGDVPNSSDNLKCALTVGKMLSKLIAGTLKCHDKMNKAFFAGKDFDEETCEETDPVSHKGALDKYNQQRDKLASLGICPSCLNSAGLDAIAANALGQADAGNSVGNPCSPSGAFLE